VKKSICFVTQSPSFGGTEMHTLSLIRSLIDRGHSLSLVCCCKHHQYDHRLASEIQTGKITLFHTDLDLNPGTWDETVRWTELLQRVKSEILIFPKGGNNLGSLNLALLCRTFFREIFWIEHGEAEAAPPFRILDPASLGGVRKRLVKKLRALNADRIIAVSDKVAERLIEDWGYSRDKITVIRNGISCRTFVRDAQRGAAFRRRYSIPADLFVFGMMTRLSDEKGIDIALRALRNIIQAHPSVQLRLVIAGTGPREERLKELANYLELPEHVVFIGFAEDPPDVLPGFDAILLPSRAEGLPLALLEGMAAGCIPIVSRVGGMPEAVDSAEVGWVVPPEDPDALSLAMHQLLQLDQSQLLRMRENVAGRIQRSFNIDECHRQFFEACGLSTSTSTGAERGKSLPTKPTANRDHMRLW
jgi:glycosyltransferase involved in cell wall biosynthesis